MNGKSSNGTDAIEQLDRYLKRTSPADEAEGVESMGSMESAGNTCELCDSPGGELVWEDDFCRVVGIADGDYPGFCRVILRQHCKEMTDLAEPDRLRLMRVVFAAETALRTVYRPDKINLASFGNVVPHLHWHVVPRWRTDRHFPQPVWGAPQRVASAARPPVSWRRIGDEIAARLSS